MNFWESVLLEEMGTFLLFGCAVFNSAVVRRLDGNSPLSAVVCGKEGASVCVMCDVFGVRVCACVLALHSIDVTFLAFGSAFRLSSILRFRAQSNQPQFP